MKRLRHGPVVVALVLLALVVGQRLARGPVVAPPSLGLANATVLIVRHAEKPASGPWLTSAGEARAQGYVGYFDRLRLGGMPVHLDWLVAAADRPQSFRSRLTLSPLSQALGLPIQVAFDGADISGVAHWLNGHAAGRTVLIAWHHSEIPALMAALGEAPAHLLASNRWPGDVYDQMVVLRYDAHGRIIPQETKLLREDIRA